MNDGDALPSHRQDTVDQTSLKSLWGAYTHEELKQRCEEIGSTEHLIDGLLPARSLGIIVGDSGLGKSALLYQVGICVAAGIPFLDRRVKQGRVLVMDFENGIGQVDEILSAIASHVGINKTPEDLLLWNFNDCPSNFGQPEHSALDLIRVVKPALAIVDSFTALYPEIEERNSGATTAYKTFREVMRESGCSILGTHHRRKPSDIGSTPLEDANLRSWFHQTRGASALINASDVRLGVDEPSGGTSKGPDQTHDEIALVVRGFARVRGEIPAIYITRVRDENGEPLGYSRASNSRLLFNENQENALARLPERFRFEEAHQTYGRGPQATTDFLNKCISLGLIRKVQRGRYEKPSVKAAE
jgi:hypothetical protein